MKKLWIKILTAAFAVTFTVACALLSLGGSPMISASAFNYRSAANGVSSSYSGSKYYQHLQNITLTGDGVTDTLSVAISQLGYQESGSVYSLAGTTSGSSGDYTEYNYNMGSINGYAYYWCATFVAWSLYQGGATNQNTQSAWCRFHMGDINYIWREVSCFYWANQLKNFGYFNWSAYKGGSYTPKAGDLIFFRDDISHIGIVRYSAGGYVYTIEGNTTDASGVESNGGGVYLKSYSLSSSSIYGYGCLPYASNASAPKIDWTGANPTEGQYITNAAMPVSSSAGGATAFTVPRFSSFSVTGFSSGYAIVSYNGSVGYANLTGYAVQYTAAADMAVEESSSYYPSGDAALPSGNHPHVKVTGLAIGGLKSYWAAETYENNKNLILINGKTMTDWQAQNTEAVKRIWIYGAGSSNACYLGLHLDDVNALRLNTQSGSGEVLQTITLKKGFTIVQLTEDAWGKDGYAFAGSPYFSSIAGVLKNDITLTAKSGGGFSISSADTGSSSSTGYTEDVTVESSSTFYAGANDAPDVSAGSNHPSVKVTGLNQGNIKSYWALETYESNKDLFYVNGKSMTEWQVQNANSIKRIWIYGAGSSNACYLGLHLDDVNVLRLSTVSGAGEVLQTIVIKKGFQIVQLTEDAWGKDGYAAASTGFVDSVAGTVQEDITLTAQSGGGFTVTVGEVNFTPDSGSTDSGNTDSGNTGSGSTDSGNTDSGNTGSGSTDSGNTDSGFDWGNTDNSGGVDNGNADSGNTGDVDNVGGDVGNNNGNEDVPTTNGGCGGSMGGMALGVLVFAGAALLLKKRKTE